MKKTKLIKIDIDIRVLKNDLKFNYVFDKKYFIN